MTMRRFATPSTVYFLQMDIIVSLLIRGSRELRLPKKKPNLIFLDNRMGGMSGIETLQHLRTAAPSSLVILMTAYGTTQTAIQAMKHGAFDYVLKPFDLSPSSRIWSAKALKAVQIPVVRKRDQTSCSIRKISRKVSLAVVSKCNRCSRKLVKLPLQRPPL
jgi:DNA-binding NtrC family response regulator